MNILIVIDSYHPHTDGAVNVSCNYASQLSKNHNVTLMTIDYPNYVDEPTPYRLVRTKSMYGGKLGRMPLPWFDRIIGKVLREGNFDVVNFHSPAPLGRYVAKRAQKLNIPVIYTAHTKYDQEIEKGIRGRWLQQLALNYIESTIRLADRVIAVSNGAKDYVTKCGYNGQVDIIRNATDMTQLESLVVKQDIAELASKYNIDTSKPVLLYTGRVEKVKNIDFTIDVLLELKDRGLEFTFVMVGEGSYRKAVQDKLVARGLKDNSVVVGRIDDELVMAQFYSMADLFVFPSTFDTSGLVVMESASMRLPSIVVENSSVAEVIEDDYNGLALPLDTQLWADRIIELLSDKDRMSRIGNNAHSTLCDNWSTTVSMVEQTFRSVIAD